MSVGHQEPAGRYNQEISIWLDKLAGPQAADLCEWLSALPKGQSTPLVLWGPPATGKSLLRQAVQRWFPTAARVVARNSNPAEGYAAIEFGHGLWIETRRGAADYLRTVNTSHWVESGVVSHGLIYHHILWLAGSA